MSSQLDTGNIFKFDSQDILKFYTSPANSNKLPYSPTLSPNSRLVDEKAKKCKKYNIINSIIPLNIGQNLSIKKNKISMFFKFIISIILIKFLFSYFDFDDILPYKIIRDTYFEKILEEIPNENDEVIKVKEFGQYKTFLASNIIKKFNHYIDICTNGKLTDTKEYSPSNEPKISVIMPLYQGGNYLHYSLRSIQNQKMKDIEIILIDDCSKDDTPLIIDKFMKEDPRIKFIKNEVNRKVLYSKSMAALNTKGKYIIQLDQDDIFVRDDLFDILYQEAEKNKFDLIQFRDITKNNFHFNKKTIVNVVGRHYILPKNNQYKKQPELKDTLYINNNIVLLWGLLINATIYKKAIYYLWKIIINYKIIFHEDYIILFIIIIFSNNYKYMNLFGLIHLNNARSSSKNHWNIKEYYMSILFVSNIISDYYIEYNPYDIKILVNFIHLFIKEFSKGKNLYPYLFDFVISKILYNNYISLTDKKFFINKFNPKKNDSMMIAPKILNSIYNFQNTSLESETNNIIHAQNYYNNITISIIIICRQFKYLDRTIYSIENQNFTNYEIILIYETNDNNEFNIINNFIKNFTNIKFFSNFPKKGSLNSIIEGVQFSKGNQILILEPGYTLAENITLSKVDNYMNNNIAEILELNLLINNDEELNQENLRLYKCTHYNSKIEKDIDNIKFNKNIREIDQNKDLLFNKIFKSESFKRIISNKMLNTKKIIDKYYDDIILFTFYKLNVTFIKSDIYGIIHYSIYTEELDKSNKINIIDESIFYIDYLYENTNNTISDKEYALKEYFDLLGTIYNQYNIISNQAYNLYQKFYTSPFISSFNKNLLKTYFHSLRKK